MNVDLRLGHSSFVGAVSLVVALASSFSACLAANPLFESADPDVLVDNGTYWVFPTNSGRIVDDSFYSYSSTDLKQWTKHGPILELSKIKWIGDDKAPKHTLWAPGIFHDGDKYYLYYSVGPQVPTLSRIGVAVANSPEGPFVDSGQPLITDSAILKFEAIDPMVFRDPKSGHVYLYCGGSNGSRLHVYELNSDLVSVGKQIEVPNPQNFTEGAFMHYRDGVYYLSYSNGHWDNDTYNVSYSTAPSPLGPWTYKGKILVTNERHAGPGHHAIARDAQSGNWYVFYHRWNDAKKSGVMPPTRSVAVERIEYDAKGDILPVKLSD